METIMTTIEAYEIFTSLVWVAVAGIAIIVMLAIIIGVMGILKKDGKSPWLALIPFVNIYALARTAVSNKNKVFPLITTLFSGTYTILNAAKQISLNGYMETGWSLASDPVFGTCFMLCSILATICLFATDVFLARRFNHGMGYAVGLFILPPFFFPMLGFEKNQNDGAAS